MKALFYVALGATAAVLVVRKVTRTAEKFTPSGMASSMGGVADAIRDFAAEVRVGMADREDELRVALGIDDAQGRA